MRFTQFKFENFKGVEDQTLNINFNSTSKIFALVGLNESGKTTILEAINYFVFKTEKLDALKMEKYKEEDIYNLIPINKRDNFNGKIKIAATIELSDDDINLIKLEFRSIGLILTSWSKHVTYTQIYWFENSVHIKEKNQSLWSSSFSGNLPGKKVVKEFTHEQTVVADRFIRSHLPSILYFPNFLFEFPEKIYLAPDVSDPTHKFYQNIIQDVLDSLGNDTNITDHLIARIISEDSKEHRNLNSLIGKMQKKLTEVIFAKWNQILNKEISKIEIILYTGQDENGPFIEFNIKDDVDTYRIVERSLGFRWFFVYILLTQFRSFRKKNKNALFLFDEPASNLHPSAQTELLNSFEKLPGVIYTTHSHYLINPKWIENTFVIKNEAIDYDNEIEYNSKNTNIKIHKYREFASKYPSQSNYFQPILEVLDYRPSNLELVPRVIITEGKNDFYTFKYFDQVIFGQDILKFVPGTSSSNLESLISLYLGWGTQFYVLLDSDREGEKQKQRYLREFGASISDLMVTYKDINTKWENTETEDLFDDVDKILIQRANYPSETTYSKKIFNRSIQELYVGNRKLVMSDDTMSNFARVLEYFQVRLNPVMDLN